MELLHTGRLAIATFTATTIFAFAGCGGARSTGAMPQTAAGSAQTAANPGSKSGGDLLYVDDGGTDYSGAYALAYTYPQGKHVATLTGFRRLTGECSDANGDVFIVAPGEELSNPTTVYEFAHGGTSPIAELSDPGEGNAAWQGRLHPDREAIQQESRGASRGQFRSAVLVPIQFQPGARRRVRCHRAVDAAGHECTSLEFSPSRQS